MEPDLNRFKSIQDERQLWILDEDNFVVIQSAPWSMQLTLAG